MCRAEPLESGRKNNNLKKAIIWDLYSHLSHCYSVYSAAVITFYTYKIRLL